MLTAHCCPERSALQSSFSLPPAIPSKKQQICQIRFDTDGVNAAKLAKLKENTDLPDLTPYLNDRFATLSPLVGAALWAIWFGLARPDWNTGVVLAVILVALPLALQIVDDPRNGPMTPAIPWIRLAVPAAGLMALLSVLVGKGFFSALLSLPWLGCASAVALTGVFRLLSRRSLADPAIGVDLGLIGLGFAGLWLFFDRWGGEPDLSPSTAYLYLFAFGAPFAVGCSARRLGSDSRLSMIASGGSILAALLSTLDGRLEVVASGVVLGVSVVVSKQLLALGKVESGVTSSLLSIAGSSLIAASVLNLVRLLVISVDPRTFASTVFQQDAVVTDAFSVAYSTLDSPTIGAVAGLSLAFLLLALLALTWEASSDDGQLRATMVHLVPRSESELLDLLRYSATLPSEEMHDAADDAPPAGYIRSQWSLRVPDFDNSCDALLGWAGHESASVRLRPNQPQVAVGETFVMAVPVGPLTVTVACRISEIVDESDRYGFAYTTLSNHVWEGSESLIVSRDPNGEALVTATICWRPTSVAAGAVPKLTTAVQARAVNACLAGIAAAESALVGDYLSTIVEEVGSRKMEVSRQSLVQKPAAPFPHTAVAEVDEPVDPNVFDPDMFNADMFKVDRFEADASEAEDAGTESSEDFSSDLFNPSGMAAGTPDTQGEDAPPKLSFDEVFSQPFDAPDLGETAEFDSSLPFEGNR